jgi:succinoglycan biosynthesis transport protein ExoP
VSDTNRLPGYTVTDLDAFNPAPQAQGHDESPFVIFERLHRLLRGRYVLALTLAALGAAGGAIAGWKSSYPLYRAEGALRISSNQRLGILSNQQDPITQFTPFVKTQANLLQDPRVINKAMASDAWRKLNRGSTPAERDDFVDSLQVVTDREEPEWIRVRFTDRSPKAASVAVEELISAYAEIHGGKELIVTDALIQRVAELKRRLEGELQSKQREIAELGLRFTSTDLAKVQNDKLEEHSDLERRFNALEWQVNQAEAAAKLQDSQKERIAQDVDPLYIAGELAKVDPTIARLFDARLTAESNAKRAQLDFGPNHRTRVSAESQLKVAESLLTDAVKRWLDNNGGVLPGLAGEVLAPAISAQSIPAAKASMENLRRRMEQLKNDLAVVSRAKLEMDAKLDERQKIQEELTQVSRRYRELTSEDSSQGRVQIVSMGEEPHRPQSDPRKKYAALGLFFGGGAPIALVMLMGLLDGRYRYSDDPGHGKRPVTLLGILPYLPEKLHDPEQASVAAHCVHQVRTLLQISGRAHDRKVFCITSPTAGDGKTSLSLSLGLSFAASGSNTCLIDFDMIGGGLTSAMQAKSDHGLMDAFDQGQLNGALRPTSFPRLSIVPIGRDDAKDVSRLSPDVVRRVIQQAREKFDIVVIDTGPILGSIEASLACAASDGVILALGRGQQRMQAERAIEYVTQLGATLVGVVFNRADAGDFRRAVSSASVRSVPVRETGLNGDGRVRALPALGPMARTVASAIQPEKEA